MGAAGGPVGKRRRGLGFCGILRVKKPGRAAKSGRAEEEAVGRSGSRDGWAVVFGRGLRALDKPAGER